MISWKSFIASYATESRTPDGLSGSGTIVFIFSISSTTRGDSNSAESPVRDFAREPSCMGDGSLSRKPKPSFTVDGCIAERSRGKSEKLFGITLPWTAYTFLTLSSYAPLSRHQMEKDQRAGCWAGLISLVNLKIIEN